MYQLGHRDSKVVWWKLTLIWFLIVLFQRILNPLIFILQFHAIDPRLSGTISWNLHLISTQ